MKLTLRLWMATEFELYCQMPKMLLQMANEIYDLKT